MDDEPMPDYRIISATDHPEITIPLDSDQRTTPIHPLLPMFKMPSPSTKEQRPLHPNTLEPLTDEIISTELAELRAKYKTPEAAAHARDELAAQMKTIADEVMRRRDEIDREIEKATKQRDMERRVYNKMMDAKRARSGE